MEFTAPEESPENPGVGPESGKAADTAGVDEESVPLTQSWEKPELSLYSPMGGEITNLTLVGRRLQDCAQEAKEMMEDHGIPWGKGRAFAEALSEWSEGRISTVAVTHDHKNADYVVGKLVLAEGDSAMAMLVDDEGLTTPDVLDGRLSMHGHEPEASLVFGEEAEQLAKTAPRHSKAVGMLTQALNTGMGSFQMWERTACTEFQDWMKAPAPQSQGPEHERVSEPEAVVTTPGSAPTM